MRRFFAVGGLVLLGLSFWITGCSKDKGNGPVVTTPYDQIRLDLYSASPLPAGFTFELWAKPSDTALASNQDLWTHLTRFNLNSSGAILDSAGAVLPESTFQDLPVNLVGFDSLYVTVERLNDGHVTPSPTVYLQGKIPPKLDSVGSLKIAPLEFPVSLTSASGRFTIMTPTDADTLADLAGIWFMTGIADPGLSIPPAPPGWIYEGWVHHRNKWLSTGKFRRATGPDLSNPYIGPGVAPNFPGEDFVQNAPPDLGFSFPLTLEVGDRVEVTCGPDPNSLVEPFPIRILSFDFITTPMSGTLKDLNGLDATIPSANATIGKSAK